MAEFRQPLICVQETGFRSIIKEASTTNFEAKDFITMRRILGYAKADAQDFPDVIAFGGIWQADGTMAMDPTMPYRVVQDQEGQTYPLDDHAPELPTYDAAEIQELVCPLPKAWTGSHLAAAVIKGEQGKVKIEPNSVTNAAVVMGAHWGGGGAAGGTAVGMANRLDLIESLRIGGVTGLVVGGVVIALPLVMQFREYRAQVVENNDRAYRAWHLRPFSVVRRPQPWTPKARHSKRAKAATAS